MLVLCASSSKLIKDCPVKKEDRTNKNGIEQDKKWAREPYEEKGREKGEQKTEARAV